MFTFAVRWHHPETPEEQSRGGAAVATSAGVAPYLPVIKVDSSKCRPNALECRLCVTHCEPVVMILGAKGMEKFRETSKEKYEVRIINRPACTGCMKCVQVCPQNAIEVSFPGRS